ncbi:MAG: hypothetical protein Q8S73_13550 [Deltaproteobacteria bacterium]|nr:hypothetical protein [Myxococcales bacterium]MDP3215126.1 hypothetical protein [Deltaproteobacteria bacterium]
MATVSSRKTSGSAPSTAQRWRERVGAWRASGLTAEAFASGEAFSASTLRWWSSRLGRAPAVSFLELVPRPAAAAPEPSRDLVVEVGPARVRVAPGFDPTLLAAVIRALAEGAR